MHPLLQQSADRLTYLYLRARLITIPRPHLVRPRLPEKGQGLVEYALILVLIAIVVIVVLAVVGENVLRVFGTITCAVQGPDNMMDCFETPEPPPA